MDAVIMAPSFAEKAPESTKARALESSWLLHLVRSLSQKLLLFPFLYCFSGKIEIEGLEKLEKVEGSCLFVANHSSHADSAIFLAALPEHLKRDLMIAAASDYFFKNKISAFLLSLLMPLFPFDRHNPHKAMHDALELLGSAKSLLIYPEGTRSKPGESCGFKKGFAALACKKGIPVLPVFIEGGYDILPKGAKWPGRGRARIVFSDPIWPSGKKCAELAALTEERVYASGRAA